MAITLDTLTLPADLVWQDEFAWSAIVQQSDWALDGSLILQESSMQAGRPITLVGGADAAWMTRAQVQALQALADAAPDANHTLTLADARSFTVRFRRGAPSTAGANSGSGPFSATPIVGYAAPEAGDFYAVQINLFQVPNS